MMKKVLAYLLVLMMAIIPMCPAAGEAAGAEAAGTEETAADEAAETQIVLPELNYDYDELTVGTTMKMYGSFMFDLWGNSGSDVDVRKLLNAYNLVEWNAEADGFRMDPSVVSAALATSDEAGNHTYTIVLYNDMYYSDGTRITAWDYAFSFLLRASGIISELGGKPAVPDYLVGWEDYANGTTEYLAGLRVINNYELSIKISADYLPYFYEVGLLDCYPYPVSAIAPGCRISDTGEGVYISNADEEETEPVFTAELLRTTLLDEETGYLSHPSVTSGPYVLTGYDGDTATFELNTYYKGNSEGVRPVIPRIVFKVVDQAKVTEEFMNGEYGLLNKVTRADVITDTMERIAQDGRFSISNYPRPGLSYFAFNTRRAAVSEPEVRKAAAMCLDKDGFMTDYVENYGLRADGFYGLGQWMYQMVNGTIAPEPAEDATEAEIAEMEEQLEALSFEGVEQYLFNTEAAAALLEKSGWNLNRSGEAFEAGKDDVRCKQTDDGLVPLELKLVYPETTEIGDILQARFAEPLKEAGILLTVEASDSVLPMYYGQVERDYDMIYLATNFDVMFDPSPLVKPDGATNWTGIDDQELYDLAVDMRKTEPGDLISYCQKWIRFLERFAEVEPMIPVYSNVYHDFYPNVLRNYVINENSTWSQAIVPCYFSDVPEAVEEEAEEAEFPD